MKLLTIINRRFLFLSITLLAACSVLLFFLMRFVIYADVKENLLDERTQIMQEFLRNNVLPSNQNLKSDRVQVTKTAGDPVEPLQFSDTMVYDSLEGDYVPHRQLSFFMSKGSEKYMVEISQSLLESDDLILTLLIFTLLFILALFAAFYLLNRKLSKSIWQPFNDTLEKLKSFDLTQQQRVSFSHSSIEEFEALNISLESMTSRIYGDYDRLKQFTENASHEIQTPLSIIRSKLEVMIQSEQLSEEQMNAIQKINEAVSRLSKLNAALLTLTKIENHQFAEVEEIHLASFIKDKIRALEELLQRKKIFSVSVAGHDHIVLKMNASLADLLFDNLISNSLKHNIEDGFINISIRSREFIISNSGIPLEVPAEKLFDRFVKNNPSSDSLGLGLAIVKQICSTYNFKIVFSSSDNIHTITLSF